MLIRYSKQLAAADKANAFTDWMYSEIKPFLKGDILEIGSGIGTYSRKIEKDFTDSRKVFSDFDPEYVIGLANEFGDHLKVSVNHLDLSVKENKGIEKESFDSAFALNVLEHIKDDVAALDNVYNLLKPGGVFVMLVPAHTFLLNCMDEAAGHYRRYSKKEIISKIRKTKFKLRHIWYFNFISIFGWYFNGKILKKTVANEGALGFLNNIVPAVRFFEKYILKKRMGISIITVLEK